MFVWQFVLHLTICVIAYGRILLVLRRQGRVNQTQRRAATVATNEPVAGPSKAVAEMEMASDTAGRDKGVSGGKAKGETMSSQNAVGQRSPTVFSKAKINVIRTMILILVCFVVCIFPIDLYFFYKTLTVSIYQLTRILLPCMK